MSMRVVGVIAILLSFSTSGFAGIDDDVKKVSGDVGQLQAEMKEVKAAIQNFNKAFQHLIPRPIETENDYVLSGFRNRLQSHLTGYFGAYKVAGAGLFERSKPTAFLAMDVGSAFLGCIPEPLEAASVELALMLVKIGYEKYQEKEDEKMYHIFSSYAAIDKASYLIADGIASIYAPQITQLSYKGAVDLADSAAHTLKWFIEHRAKKDKILGGRMIKPDELVLVIGQYYKPEDSLLRASKDPYKFCKKLDRKPNSNLPESCYDMDIFLASGIKVGETGYHNNATHYLYGNKKWDLTDNHFVYTAGLDGSSSYGYRNANQVYLEGIQQHLVKRRRHLSQTKLSLKLGEHEQEEKVKKKK
jgi:hypothetical protein